METDLQKLLGKLYANTTMMLDDILFVAKINDITIDVSADDKITAIKNGEEITFDVISYDDGTIFIFDIE